MSKRKGQTNGSTTRNQTSPAASGNAPEIDAAGTPLSADSTAVDTASLMAGSDGVDGAADGKELSDGGRKKLPELEAGEGATPDADTETADTSSENVSGDIGAGSGSGSIENDGDASADGAADDGKDGSVSGEANGQAGSVGGGNPAAADGGGGSAAGNGDQVAAAADSDGLPGAGPDISPDLKAALELAGCSTVAELVDMAGVVSNLMDAIDDIRSCDGPFKDWTPAEDPVEIVHDLFAAVEHYREKTTSALVPAHSEALTDAIHDALIFAGAYAPENFPESQSDPEFWRKCNPDNIIMNVADDAFRSVAANIEVISAILTGEQVRDPLGLSTDAAMALQDFVRKIGRRATPEILAQQLLITKHRQSAELTPAEHIGLKTFIAVLLDLNDFAAVEKKRLEELAAEKPTPRPVPIEDTTMEVVDDPTATW